MLTILGSLSRREFGFARLVESTVHRVAGTQIGACLLSAFCSILPYKRDGGPAQKRLEELIARRNVC